MRTKLLFVALMIALCTGFLAGAEKGRAFYLPHPAAGQFYANLNGDKVESGPGVGQSDGQVEALAVMAPQSSRIVRILISIFNKTGNPVLFIPGTAYVTLPNGHSYAPYTQTDAIEALVRSETSRDKSNAGYNPPPDTLKTNCTTYGATTNCATRVDSSQRSAYDAGFGIGSAIGKLIATHQLKNKVKTLQEGYLTSRYIDPLKDIAGGIDVYVEDLNSGPYKLTLPVGSTTFSFIFGPDGSNEELPK